MDEVASVDLNPAPDGDNPPSITMIDNSEPTLVSSNIENNNETENEDDDEDIDIIIGDVFQTNFSVPISESERVGSETSSEFLMNQNLTLLTDIQATPVTSSNYVSTNEEIIQSMKKSLESFFTQTVTDFQAYKSDLRSFLLNASAGSNKSLKNSRQQLHSNLKGCKKGARSLLKIPCVAKNRSVKHVQMSSYTDCIKRINKVSERILKDLVHFTRFGQKISSLVLLKETQAFAIFSDFLLDIKSLIITLAYSNMFTELANHQDILNELRVSVEIGLARASRNKRSSTATSTVIQDDNNSLNPPTTNTQQLYKETKEWKDVQEIFDQQIKICPGNSKQFLADFNRATQDFYLDILAKATELGRHNLSHEDKFNQILGDVRLRFPLSVLENIRHRKCQISIRPTDKMYPVTLVQQTTGRPSTGESGTGTGSRSDDNLMGPAHKQFELKSKYKKKLRHLITGWEKYLISHFKIHSDYRKSTEEWMRSNFSEYFTKSEMNLTSNRVETFLKIRKVYRKMNKSIRSKIKRFVQMSADRKELPSAVDLLDLENITAPDSFSGIGGTGPGCHRQPNTNKLRSIDKYLLRVEEQEYKVAKIMEKWSSELLTLSKSCSEEFVLIILHNQRHIDPWLFRDSIIQAAEIIVPSFQDEIKITFDEVFEMILNLIYRLGLEKPKKRRNQQNQQQGQSSTDPTTTDDTEDEDEIKEGDEERLSKQLEIDRQRLDSYIASFVVHFNIAMQQFSQHLEFSCRIIHNFCLGTKDFTKRSMHQVHKSLVNFARAQGRPGLSRIMVTTSSIKNPNDPNLQNDNNNDNTEEEEEAINESSRTIKNHNQSPMFMPTILPQSPFWTAHINAINIVKDQTPAGEGVGVMAPGDEQVAGKSESLKQFQRDFIQNYVNAALQETNVPSWADRNNQSA